MSQPVTVRDRSRLGRRAVVAIVAVVGALLALLWIPAQRARIAAWRSSDK